MDRLREADHLDRTPDDGFRPKNVRALRRTTETADLTAEWGKKVSAEDHREGTDSTHCYSLSTCLVRREDIAAISPRKTLPLIVLCEQPGHVSVRCIEILGALHA